MRISSNGLRLQSVLRASARRPGARRPSAAAFATTAYRAHTAAHSTINHDEIAFFSKLSALWWDERGEFQMLHRMNPIRMQFIREKLVSSLAL